MNNGACVALIRLQHLLPRIRAREKANTIESVAFYLPSLRSPLGEWEKVPKADEGSWPRVAL